jgi:hypothetical protein
MSGKALARVTGIIASVIVAAIVAYLNIGNPPGVTINGPSTVVDGNEFSLYGHVNGSYGGAFWIDTFGRAASFRQDAPEPFICPGIGQFTVTLTEVSGTGDEAQAVHDITCRGSFSRIWPVARGDIFGAGPPAEGGRPISTGQG